LQAQNTSRLYALSPIWCAKGYISSPFTSTTRWSLQYVEWLKTITFETAYLKEAFDLLIELYEYLTRQIARISRTVVLLCRDKKYRQKIKLLCTAPGIGKLTTSHYHTLASNLEAESFTRLTREMMCC
jgi:hypothetical protein